MTVFSSYSVANSLPRRFGIRFADHARLGVAAKTAADSIRLECFSSPSLPLSLVPITPPYRIVSVRGAALTVVCVRPPEAAAAAASKPSEGQPSGRRSGREAVRKVVGLD
eukprot:GHVU01036174.1.p1 GENE.GHVU01036174.1~~GHVU01036174.1.p1  ORF type:complete len:110 (-),score=10.10 GHVU01036174.1:280-609(-)